MSAPIRSALWLPLFDELADPRVVAGLAAEAEEAGWDGVFVWDHVRWRGPVRAIADTWVTLTAMTTATERVRLGPMVTALPRRRPAKLARETASLDLFSGGRLVLGVGLGSDRFGAEFSRFGDEVDERLRAAMVDEALPLLKAAWTGEPVRHHGEYYVLDDVTFLPRPAQPSIPVWGAGFPGKQRPLHRAARYDGYFPVNLAHPDQLAEALSTIRAIRPDPAAPYDVVIPLAPGDDIVPYADAGATWWAASFDPDAVTVDQVRAVVRDGPAPRTHLQSVQRPGWPLASIT